MAAWLAGDGSRFAAPFSAMARFVAFDAAVLMGPDQIAAFHQTAFENHLRGTVLEREVQEFRTIREAIWLVVPRAL